MEENLNGVPDMMGLSSQTIDILRNHPENIASGFIATDPFTGQKAYDDLTNQPYNSQPLQSVTPRIPPGISLNDYAKSANSSVLNKLNQADVWGKDVFQSAKPYTFGTGAQHTNFDRYYNHPKFDELGFTPFRDNETFYNENSTAFDDLIRSAGQWGNIFGSTIVGGYRSLGDIASGDFFKPDLTFGRELEEAMNIGYSSRGGLMGGFNNLFLQSAIPVAIMTDFALSEGLLALTGNIPGMGAKLVQEGVTIGRAAEALSNASKLREFYQGARNAAVTATEFFLPNTVKNLAEYGAGTQKIANFANVVGSFGDFYKDVRNMNYALSEAKIEGGSVKNQFAQEHIAEIIQNEGRNPTDEEMAKIMDYANDAGYSTTIVNAPIIFASNKLILDNLFSTPKYAQRSALESMEYGSKYGTKLVYDATKAAEGQAFRELSGTLDKLKFIGQSLKRPSTYLTGGVNYFKANIMEGLQEVTQETISGTAMDYYNRLYTDPSKGGIDYALGDTWNNVKKQASAEGLEVFASGFFMGGLMSVGGRLVSGGISGVKSAQNKYYKARNPEAYQQEYEAEKTRTKEIIDSLNELYKDPMQFFSPDRETLIEQHRLNKGIYNAQTLGEDKDFIDLKDSSTFNGIYNAIRLNRYDSFIDMLRNFRDLSGAELKQALKLDDTYTEDEARALLESSIKRAEKIKDNANKYNRQNPFNPERFSKRDINNNPEIREQYNQEAFAYLGFEDAKRQAIFSMYGFERAKERMASIADNLRNNPAVAKAAYSDIEPLLSPGQLDREIEMLKNEIDSLEGSTDPYNIKQLENKKQKLEKLQALQTKFAEQGPQLQTFEFWATPDVREAFKDYIKTLALVNDDYYSEEKALDAINKLADYYLLQGDANKYSEVVNAYYIPENFYKQAARNAKFRKDFYDKRERLIKEAIDNFEKIKGNNELLNLLFDNNIAIEPTVLSILMQASPDSSLVDIITSNDNLVFIDTLTNQTFTRKDTEQFKKVQDVIDDYKARRPEGEEVATEEEAAVEEVPAEERITPQAETPAVQVPTITTQKDYSRLPVDLKRIINGNLAQVNSKREADGLDPLDLMAFIQSARGKQIISDYFNNPNNADQIKAYYDKVGLTPAEEAPATPAEQPAVTKEGKEEVKGKRPDTKIPFETRTFTLTDDQGDSNTYRYKVMMDGRVDVRYVEILDDDGRWKNHLYFPAEWAKNGADEFEAIIQEISGKDDITFEKGETIPFKSQISDKQWNTLTPDQQRRLDPERAALEQPKTKTIKSNLVGKVVYATPASGKTTAAQQSEDIVDGDTLLLDELRKIPNYEATEASDLPMQLGILAVEDTQSFDQIYNNALSRARELAGQGKTVLFGSKRLINDVDVVITSDNTAENNKRIEDKFVASGQKRSEAKKAVTALRKAEKAITDKAVISIPFDEYIFMEEEATPQPVERSYQTKFDKLIDGVNNANNLKQLKEAEEEGLRQGISDDVDKALEFDKAIKDRENYLRNNVNFDNVKVGDILALQDNRYAAVVSKTANNIKYKPLYGENLAEGKQPDKTYTIRKQDFSKAVVTMYDNESDIIVGAKEIAKPTTAEKKLIAQNQTEYVKFADDTEVIAASEKEAREQSADDINNEFLDTLGCE